jgi:hypothetical protein
MSFKQATRKYGFVEALAFTGTSAQSAALTGVDEVMLVPTQDCWVSWGSNPTASSTPADGSLFLAAGVPFHMQITNGYEIAAVNDGTNGTLTIFKAI